MRKPLEILLVEDNEGDIEMTQRVFRDGSPPAIFPWRMMVPKRWTVLFKRGNFVNAPTPQLILLDINMPGMDGKRFLELMKKEQRIEIHSRDYADQLAISPKIFRNAMSVTQAATS